MIRTPKPTVRTWYSTAILVVALIVVGVGVAFLFKNPVTITNFSACEKAGGAILTTYPEQCVIDGKTFTNAAGQQSDKGQTYIGLPERVALERASRANVPARVVERDGESLPVTMDYVLGRLNLYVKDGVVYRVAVEK